MGKYVELTLVKKKSGMTVLTSNLRAKGISKDGEGQDIVIKRSVQSIQINSGQWQSYAII